LPRHPGAGGNGSGVGPALLLAGKEAGALLRGGQGLALLLVLCLVLSIFGLLLVGDSELSLLDNAQVVYDMMAIVTALGALIAVILGSDSIAGERERGTLVSLLLTPVPARGIVLGKIGALLLAWVVIYAIALPYLWAVGSTGQNLLPAIAYLALFGTPAVLTFGFLAIGVSARARSTLACLIVGLVVLVVAGSPLVVGPSLRQTAVGRIFDLVNPISAAVNSYDSVVIDSEPLQAQLPRLAVVALWLGASFAFALRRAAAPGP
jgi:ABC-type transport system involved in multi-copper enzyme maturation permease subunit